MRFFIVDAFTETLFGGNPAGIVLLPQDAGFPDRELMRKTAAELRYSETAFVRRVSNHEFQTRYFTPVAEVDLCGHATVAAFHALLSMDLIGTGMEYVNETRAGKLLIRVEGTSAAGSRVMMEMGRPEMVKEYLDLDQVQELYSIMGLSHTKSLPKLPPQIVSTGLPDILLPVPSRKELSAVAPDFAALSGLSKRLGVVGVHAFALQDDAAGPKAFCRNFAPLYGIPEEAATGTASGALTYYLFRHGLWQDGESGVYIQGQDMGRPSRIQCRLDVAAGDEESGDIKIQVGGAGAVLAEGELHINFSQNL